MSYVVWGGEDSRLLYLTKTVEMRTVNTLTLYDCLDLIETSTPDGYYCSELLSSGELRARVPKERHQLHEHVASTRWDVRDTRASHLQIWEATLHCLIPLICPLKTLLL